MQQAAYPRPCDMLTLPLNCFGHNAGSKPLDRSPSTRKVGMIMSTKSIGLDMAVPEAGHAPPSGGYFARLRQRFEHFQEQKAQRYVRPYLRRLTDRELAQLGLTPADIAAIRADHTPPPHWL